MTEDADPDRVVGIAALELDPDLGADVGDGGLGGREVGGGLRPGGGVVAQHLGDLHVQPVLLHRVDVVGDERSVPADVAICRDGVGIRRGAGVPDRVVGVAALERDPHQVADRRGGRAARREGGHRPRPGLGAPHLGDDDAQPVLADRIGVVHHAALVPAPEAARHDRSLPRCAQESFV